MAVAHFNNNGKEIFALIDSNALIHRAYHAYPSTLTTVSGEQVNAVYGFTSMLFNVLETIKPTYIACAFDLPKPTFRHLEYIGYKANRREPDEEMKPQFARVRQVVEALNIPIFAVEGYEADDVIGTLCRQIDELDPQNQVNTIIVTGDKDALQLIDANTKVWLPGKTFKDMKLYGIEEVKERFGLAPKQIIDLKAIAGDPSDEIPGVKGVGDKGATTLLQEFGTVENIYENLDKVPSRYAKKFAEEHESAIMSKQLATIVTDVPITLNYEDSVLADYDKDSVLNLFQELQFRSLIKRLPQSTRESKNKTQIGLFSSEAIQEQSSTDTKVLQNQIEVEKFFDKANSVKSFSYHICINAENELECLSVNFEEEESYVLPAQIIKGNALSSFKTLFENIEVEKCGYDIKSDLHVLEKLGISAHRMTFDIMLAAYLLGFSGGNLDLRSLAFSELGTVVEDKKPTSIVLIESYSGKMVSVISKLQPILKKRLEEEDKIAGLVWKKLVKGEFEKFMALPDYRVGVKDLFYKVEMPILSILAQMESNGILVDESYLHELKSKFDKKVSSLEKEIYEIVGHEFNIASSRQLADILFVELQLPPVKKLKTGYSTAASVLEELRPLHPIIKPIEEYRELTKLVSTYVDGLLPLIQKDGKIHTTYNQAVAITGRLSSSNPNLQNIPIRSKSGNEIRKCFIASEDSVFVAIDYSQIELRLAAHVAGEDKMLAAFNNGLDIHAATAAEIFDVPVAEVKKDQRRVAKTVNFAVLYGVSAYGLSQQMNATPEEAAEIIDRYFEEYPEIHKYIDRVKELAHEHGYLESMFGRKALVRNINNSNFAARKAAERFSINFPMQSSASDIMKVSMIEASDALELFLSENKKVEARMLLQIHDEIVFEYREEGKSRSDLFKEGEIVSENLVKFAKNMKAAMENVIKLSIPLSVGVEIGNNLCELEEIDFE